jgi:surfeit locus 1 family protein
MILNIPKVLSAFFFFAGLVLLFGLGIWQIQRGEWKEEILLKLQREFQINATQHQLNPIDLVPPKGSDYHYRRGFIEGRFLQDKTTYWPKIRGGTYGLYMLDPFQMKDGEIIMVNRGWVAEDMKTHTPTQNIPPPKFQMKIAGAVKTLDSGPFTLDNEPKSNRWHRFRPNQIAEYLDLDNLAPTVFVIENILNARDYGLGTLPNTKEIPHNRHRLYALFWFTLAGLWVVILGLRLFKPKYNQ